MVPGASHLHASSDVSFVMKRYNKNFEFAFDITKMDSLLCKTSVLKPETLTKRKYLNETSEASESTRRNERNETLDPKQLQLSSKQFMNESKRNH